MATVETISQVSDITSLGEATFPTSLEFEDTVVGGLSGIVYDAERGRYYAISDDRSQFDPARFYTLEIDLADGALDDGDVTFTDVTTLLRADGTPFPTFSIDPEGIALTADGLFISSEGDANALLSPFVDRFALTGERLESLPIDDKFTPTPASAVPQTGIRNNLAFESLTVTPDGGTLYTATENALFQDGAAATVSQGSTSRIVRYDVVTGEATAEFLYVTDPIAETPAGPAPFGTSGLVELLAIDDAGTLLAIERSFSTGGSGGGGTGNTIRIYQVSLRGATDVTDAENAQAALADGVVAASKTLVLDLETLGIALDNIEGVSFGPPLADGRQSLILVSDNNFAATAFTQVLAFAIDLDEVTVFTTDATDESLSATAGEDLFLFDNAAATGADRIDGFGATDLVLTRAALFDSNGDGTIKFGGDRRLDLSTGRNELTIFGEDGKRITALEFAGVVTQDGAEYFAYSLVGASDLAG